MSIQDIINNWLFDIPRFNDPKDFISNIKCIFNFQKGELINFSYIYQNDSRQYLYNIIYKMSLGKVLEMEIEFLL